MRLDARARNYPEPFELPHHDVIRLDLTDLALRTGRFAFAQLKDAQLLGIAAKICNGEELTAAEMRWLVTGVPLALLGKLVQACTEFPTPAQRPRIRPVCYVPLAAWLEEGGKGYALRMAKQTLSAVSRDISLNKRLFIAIDRWHGHFALEDLLDTTCELRLFDEFEFNLSVLGPSTLEIREMLQASAIDLDRQPSLLELLSTLRQAGITSVEGGSDLEIHEPAAALGFSLAVGQPFYSDEDDAVESLQLPLFAGERHNAERRRITDRFLSDLLIVRSRLTRSGLVAVWFPWAGSSNTGHSNSLAGISTDIIRSIALARLLLREVEYIRAPLSRFGRQLAEIALWFGANDLGFAAVDSRTAAALGICRMSLISEIADTHVRFKRVIGV